MARPRPAIKSLQKPTDLCFNITKIKKTFKRCVVTTSPLKDAVFLCNWSRAVHPSAQASLMIFFTAAALNGHTVMIEPKQKAELPLRQPSLYIQIDPDTPQETLTGWASMLGFRDQYLSLAGLPPPSHT